MSNTVDRLHRDNPLTMKKISTTWFPLVLSWMLMSIEMPIITAIIARLANPEVNLAAYGGVSYPVAVAIEAPIVMLLAASTALSRDWDSYRKLRKITLVLGGACMFLHVLIASTPLFNFVAGVLLAVPEEVIEPARLGMLFMAPWSLGIGFRRFQQGAMIRFNHSHMVGETTIVRLVTVGLVLLIGFSLRTIPSTILAGFAQGLGVSAEAVYAGLRVRKFQDEIKQALPSKEPLSLKRFTQFYIPLVLTTSLGLLWQPLVSGAVSRMPNPLESLAVWSVIGGLLFLFRSPGLAYNEAVVALLEEVNGYQMLKRFAHWAALISAVIASILVFSPLSNLWFEQVSRLPENLVPIAVIAMAISVPTTFMTIYISLFQGVIVHIGKTNPIAEAVVIFLLTMGGVLIAGIVLQNFEGIYVAVGAYTFAHFTQAFWLMLRSRKRRQLLAVN